MVDFIPSQTQTCCSPPAKTEITSHLVYTFAAGFILPQNHQTDYSSRRYDNSW